MAVIDAGEEALGRLEADLASADAAYLDKAEALSKGRRKAASALDKAVQAELPPLKLERARFITEIAHRSGEPAIRPASTGSSSGPRPIPAPGPAR